jgi:D-alanyl-D-alanine carboxypeptidase
VVETSPEPLVTVTQRPAAPASLSAPPPVSARAYAFIDRACGAFVYGFNEHERLPPASLTKILTAMVVERVEPNLDQMVYINVSGSQMAKRGSSVMGLEPGMVLSIRDLLYGLQLPSGNDAAMALAEHIGGGNVQRFVDLMNEEAARLGLHNTHFANPHGLDNPALYSSAYDLALAGRAYLDYPVLAQISVTPYYMPAWEQGALKNGNKLLEQYPGAYGVKIGYTTKARQTIVAAASRDGRELILSILGSDNRYTDSTALFNWAFSQTRSAC